jgi:hypothetical protein
VSYDTGTMEYLVKPEIVGERRLGEYLVEARELFETIDPSSGPLQDDIHATASFDDLRWFLLPNEVRSVEQ